MTRQHVSHIDLPLFTWLAETAGLTLEEEGLYARLIIRQALAGGLLEVAEVVRICAIRPQVWRRLWPKLARNWRETGGKLGENWCETQTKLAVLRRFQASNAAKIKHLRRADAAAGALANTITITNTIDSTPPKPNGFDPPTPSRKRSKETPVPLPDGWAPKPMHYDFAIERGRDERWVHEFAERFRTQCAAKGYRYVNHDQACLAWMQKELSNGQARQSETAAERRDREGRTATFAAGIRASRNP